MTSVNSNNFNRETQGTVDEEMPQAPGGPHGPTAPAHTGTEARVSEQFQSCVRPSTSASAASTTPKPLHVSPQPAPSPSPAIASPLTTNNPNLKGDLRTLLNIPPQEADIISYINENMNKIVNLPFLNRNRNNIERFFQENLTAEWSLLILDDEPIKIIHTNESNDISAWEITWATAMKEKLESVNKELAKVNNLNSSNDSIGYKLTLDTSSRTLKIIPFEKDQTYGRSEIQTKILESYGSGYTYYFSQPNIPFEAINKALGQHGLNLTSSGWFNSSSYTYSKEDGKLLVKIRDKNTWRLPEVVIGQCTIRDPNIRNKLEGIIMPGSPLYKALVACQESPIAISEE